MASQVGKQLADILTKRGVPFIQRFTTHPGHATELSREAVENGAETVLAVGGDGTSFETAVGLMGTKTALGVIPAGTGNDFIKATGTPAKWMDALDFILTHPARPVDAGRINDTYFLNVCGTGFDVMVLDYAEKAKKYVRGLLPYLYGVVRTIFSYRPCPMHIQLDDGTVLDGGYLVCSVANGRYIGGGIPICPVAEVGDGLLDVVVVDNVPRWKIPFYLPSLMSGTLLKRRIAHHYRCVSCTLSSPSMRLNLDGEILPMSQACFTCLPKALLLHW